MQGKRQKEGPGLDPKGVARNKGWPREEARRKSQREMQEIPKVSFSLLKTKNDEHQQNPKHLNESSKSRLMKKTLAIHNLGSKPLPYQLQ